MDNSANPAAPRRRRRKKIATSKPPCSSSNEQDATLDNEVDSYLQRGRAPSRKRHRHGAHGGCSDAPPGSIDDIPRSLPMLLHLREAGLGRRFPCRGRNISWRSLMLHQSVSDATTRNESSENEGPNDSRYSALARLRVPVHPSSAPNAQWNALQYSSPTYYGVARGNATHQSGDHIRNNNIQLHRQLWRLYTRQRIPFSQLRTSHNDAILAVDRWGSYMVGVGSSEAKERGAEGKYPHLAIKFYGVPSPSRLQMQSSTQTVSPLVHIAPLLFKRPSSTLDHNEHASPAAETPMKILLSECGSLGVAFLHHSSAAAWADNNGTSSAQSQDEDNIGTIVLFEPPRVVNDLGISRSTKSFHCANVRLGGWLGFTLRNVLWPATLIPIKAKGEHSGLNEVSSPFSKDHFHEVLSAYMLFNDEDDGFRITWINVGSDVESEAGNPFVCAPNSIRPSRNDIVVPTDGNAWDGVVSDSETGFCFGNHCSQAEHSMLDITHEVYLHVDALLSDIMARRQSSLFKNSPYQNEGVCFMPDFHYNLISASPDKLRVLLVIVFSNKEKQMQSTKKIPAALGVYVEVNLYDQTYNELKWVQHPSCHDALGMKQWCNSLALNWRMKERRVGVFCLDGHELGPPMDQWVGPTHEVNVDEDMGDDTNVALWREYVERRRTGTNKGCAVPKDISMSSLYPHCDVVTNRAVHTAIPVKRMASRNSPVELIYG